MSQVRSDGQEDEGAEGLGRKLRNSQTRYGDRR